MGHNIWAVIGPPEIIARIVDAAGCPAPTPLPFGLVIAPLGEQQIDRLTALDPGNHTDGFTYLSERLQLALAGATKDGAAAYVETNYFGGTGSQAAAVFSEGKMILEGSVPVSRQPPQHDDPINTALRALGVEAAPGQDEFDTLGLRRFRDLEALGLDDWDED